MSSKKKLNAIAAAAAAVAITAAVLLAVYIRAEKTQLVLSDEDTGRVFLSLPAADGDRFSITFVHSVNQTPVTDIFEIRGDDIYVVECRFYSFGAGMQTEYPEGVTYSYADDGAIVATGYDILCKDLIYCVGKVSDHILNAGGEEYSLRDICGRGAMVRFCIT